MIVENLLPLLLVCGVVFGLLWLVIEASVKLGDMLTNRKG
jgi:hypothetical protein